ncbi:MAG: hypothetical protein ACYDC3_15035 [Candidatus Binataceae bacterium]
MRGYQLAAAILNWVQHTSQWMQGPAIVVSRSALATGILAGSSGSAAARGPSAHDLFLTAVALTIEIALFISIPIYLRARRRDKIRSRIRILYDSRGYKLVRSGASPADSQRGTTAPFSSMKPPISPRRNSLGS